jgi:NAD(P)-dependent dehydrogenase (short-subunit alcohol dehydrogenase family)
VSSDPFAIDGRVAIITGGSRGLGRAMALGFAERGARVVVSSRSASACDEVVETITGAGGEAVAVAADMASLRDIGRMVEATVDRFGAIDIVVNNAADSTLAAAVDIDEALYDYVHAINAKGPFFLAQRALPHLERSGHGSIVNVISVGVWNGGAMMQLYRASKSSLLGSTLALAKEWAARGVRVNAIAPGTFETDMIDWMDGDARARAIAYTPQQRVADPVEIVPAALYLASDASSFMTGSVLRIDGGMLSF